MEKYDQLTRTPELPLCVGHSIVFANNKFPVSASARGNLKSIVISNFLSIKNECSQFDVVQKGLIKFAKKLVKVCVKKYNPNKRKSKKQAYQWSYKRTGILPNFL